jgi:hypothetical protein
VVHRLRVSATRTTLDRLWSTSGLVFQAVLLLGVLLAVSDERAGAWLLLAAVTGLVATHLAISFVAYRRIMRRPWPEVAPPNDDDWDD